LPWLSKIRLVQRVSRARCRLLMRLRAIAEPIPRSKRRDRECRDVADDRRSSRQC